MCSSAHLPYKDPNDPESARDEDHEQVEQEIGKAIALLHDIIPSWVSLVDDDYLVTSHFDHALRLEVAQFGI